MSLDRPRFFSWEQKKEHAENIGGWNSELVDEFGNPIGIGTLESHHGLAYSQGGETTEENHFFLNKVAHAVVHLISDEPWSAKLIEKRMTPEELEEYHRLGY